MQTCRAWPYMAGQDRSASRGLPRWSQSKGKFQMALTRKKIRRLTTAGRHADGHGLYLQVVSGTNRSWLFRYERHGRERWMGLGPLHTFNLDEARELARKARQQIKDGLDPLEARRAARQAAKVEASKTMTFKQCADTYYEFHADKWKNEKWRKQFKATMRDYVHPKIGHLPVASIDTGLVMKCVEPIWKTKTPTADRVRRRIQAVLDWATVRNYRTGENPARWDGHIEHLLARAGTKPEHHAALPYAQAPTFMAELRAVEGVSARALELAVLTALRTREVIGARWSEIDFDSKMWTVPASRMKGEREHRVPLASRALIALREMPRLSDFVFPGERSAHLAHDAMDKVLAALGYKDGRATVHGFRSTFRDWAAETTGYPNHVVEMALAHTIGSKVEAAYRRGDLLDKRRRLMEDWSRYCAATPVAAEVVPMKGRGR